MKKDKKDAKKSSLTKYVRLKTILILISLLAFNSYAWFVFATRVSGGMTAHVTSWNITFQVGDNETITNVNIDVNEIYPGMPTYIKKITVKNVGETIANLYYQYQSIRILDQDYIVGENCTSEELENKILNEYPFKINIDIENQELGNGIRRRILHNKCGMAI